MNKYDDRLIYKCKYDVYFQISMKSYQASVEEELV